MKRWVSLLTMLILLFAACRIFAESDLFSQMSDWLAGETESEEEIAETALDEDFFEEVVANDRLSLKIKKTGSELVIEDLASGAKWASRPEGLVDETILPELVAKDLKSLFVFNYTDERGVQVTKTNPLSENAKVTATDIENGRKLTFDMKEIKIKISLELVLGDGYLDVSIAEKGIMEYGKNKVIDIEVLPYFGAATQSDDGYIILPEGNGGLVLFSTARQMTANNFSEYVYGGNEFAFESPIDRDTMDTARVMLPVIGMVKNSAGFLGVITEGDESAKVNVSPAGFVMDLYRTSVTFVVRNQYRFRARWSEYVDAVEEKPLICRRSVRYYFTGKEGSDYVALARKYSDYLLEVKKVEKTVDETPSIQVRVFGGTAMKALIGSKYIASTTFAQARNVLTRLKDAGIENIDAVLVGWSSGGYSERLPRRFPIEKKLGGEKGLKELADYCKENLIKLVVEDNYLDAYKGRKGFSSIRDVIRGLDKLPVNSIQGRYLLNPVFAYDKYARVDIPELANSGIRGIDMKYLGEVVMADRNRKHPLTRSGFVESWLNLAELARKSTGYLLSQGGNAYVIGHVDGITQISLSDSANEMVDVTVPFYQIALHGIIPYYTEPGNLRSDFEREFLKLIEYGALPSFEITYGPTSDLKQTNYNTLFSSRFNEWEDEIVREYNAACKDLGFLQNHRIISHRKLAQGIMETGYDDGTKVIVNYNPQPFEIEGRKIEALSYLKVKGGTGI